MENKARKIQIHIRTQKRVIDTPAHKKARVHKHAHVHDAVREALRKAHQEKMELERQEAERLLREREEARRKEEVHLAYIKSEKEKAEHLAQVKLAEEEEARLLKEREEKERAEAAARIALAEEEARRQVEELAHKQAEKDRAEEVRIELLAHHRRTLELLATTPPVVIAIPPPPVVVAPQHSAEALVPAKLVIPKKHIVVEGIPVSRVSVAYFCMEMSIESAIPTFAGGLGILAGDTLRSAADLSLDTIGVTLLYRKGYFSQRFDESGWQIEDDDEWDPLATLILLPQIVELTLEGRIVSVRAWLYKVAGEGGHINPLIFLDTDFAKNTAEDRLITSKLYSGDRTLRLKQEAILGIAGIRVLKTIGATNIQKFHMNEGHSALLTLELYRQYGACDEPAEEVRRRTVFTTHTPVAAGHDVFTKAVALEVLGVDYIPKAIAESVLPSDGLNMTHLGLMFSGYTNGVAKKHGEVTRELFPGYQIESITNGVHVRRWVAPEIATLYDRYIPGWRIDAYNLRYALMIPAEELWSAHQEVKARMCAHINSTVPGAQFDPSVFTIGFARRATAYKRGNMLFRDIERLKYIAGKYGGIQIIYSGKAHPEDREGKLIIQNIIREMMALTGTSIRAVYLPNYNVELAKLLVSGVDVWLNTPVRPQEASGTSGMKAAINGVPHFSTLDGWWLEGHIENVTGWSVGPHPEVAINGGSDAEDVEDLYTKLEYIILPKYTGDKHSWIKMMRSAIAINGSFFNTQRMVEQYVLGAYFK